MVVLQWCAALSKLLQCVSTRIINFTAFSYDTCQYNDAKHTKKGFQAKIADNKSGSDSEYKCNLYTFLAGESLNLLCAFIMAFVVQTF